MGQELRDNLNALRGIAEQLNAATAEAGAVVQAAEIIPAQALLAFGRRVLEGARVTVNLSEKGDVREAAVNLFAHLHTLDATGLPVAVMPIPLDGLGEAINDRLSRAAAKRDQS